MATKKSNWMTQKQYDEAFDMWWDDFFPQQMIANEFRCSQPHISRVVNGHRQSFETKVIERLAKLLANIDPHNNPNNIRSYDAKLTQRQATRIRNAYFFAKATQVELAQQYRVNQSAISKIISGQTYRRQF